MMKQALYASFHDVNNAKRAVGALLDHGISNECITLIARDDLGHKDFSDDAEDIEGKAKKGITTTTAGDAGAGAMKGGGIGLALGALGALVSLAIPGFGLVLGGGALATALAAAAGTTVGGAIVGAVHGFLKDQGVPGHIAERYEETVRGGGALLALQPCDDDDLDTPEIRDILLKYGAELESYPFTGMRERPTTTRTGTTPAMATGHTHHAGHVHRDIGHTHQDDTSVRLHEEELDVHKHERKAGEVQVRKDVVTEEKSVQVPVKREEVVVERHPVSGTAHKGSIQETGASETVRVPVRQEEVHVEKKVRPVEDVHVGIRQETDMETVSDTVRKEKAVIEEKGDVTRKRRR
ncbi:MAG: YsnF/AvaK domain-containing protein [Armatimonadetes bacterium]|nr:YsnF/AvaK domain-containing protein [Armatimonadota bacterium]